MDKTAGRREGAASLSQGEAELAEFTAQNSPDGLLRRYARGRVRHFVNRQWLTLAGSLTLAALVAPWVGLAAAGIALLGEAVDCGTLARVPRMLDRGVPVARLVRLTTATGAVQAIAIAACVALAWIAAPHQLGVFLSMAYLAGAAINAGVVLPFHRPVTAVRLAIYGATLVGLFAFDIAQAGGAVEEHLLFDALAATMLAYTAYVFIGYVARSHAQAVRDARDLLAGQRDLARANAALEDRQRELRQLSLVAETAQDGIVIGDARTRPLWINRAFTEMTGHTLDRLAGQGLLDILKGAQTETRTLLDIQRALREARPLRCEIVVHDSGGRAIWTDLQIVPTRDAEGRPDVVIAILRDITAAKDHARALARSKRAAEASERAKSQFLATMSHEIRTPLNGILGMSELASGAGLTGEVGGQVRTIRSSAEALLNIVNDILDLSRLEAGEVVIAERPFDPSGVVAQAVELMRPAAHGKGLALNLDIAPGLPGLLLGDDGRLRQIVLNLLGNAVKFTSTGSVAVTVRHEAAEGGIALCLTVRDTGIGVPAHAADLIFERFRQADAALTREYGGTGLGLSIARRLARRMGGDLWLDRDVADGASFGVRVVLADAAETAAGSRPTQAVNAPEIPAGLRVLVAEDNDVNRLVIEKYLSGLPLVLDFAANGEEAVTRNAVFRPDLVFMDMSMPVMDGLAATRAIRAAKGPQPRIVALTANAYARDRADCMAAGMDAFLSKPVSRRELLAAIAGATAQSPPDRVDPDTAKGI